MRRNLLSVAALLFGTLFLFMGNGLQGILLPVRGNLEGYATTTLGLLGTSWAAGFVVGCLVAPNMVRRVGHVRAFSGFISIIAISASSAASSSILSGGSRSAPSPASPPPAPR